MSEKYSVIGRSVPRVDGLEKVTGRAKFCSEKDLILPGLLYGKMLRGPYPHAKIISIDTSKAERLPGVKAVVTGKDAPPGRFGFAYFDQDIPARDVVRFAGEIVAAVAAESPEVANEAIKLIEVKYEELPAVFDVEEAALQEPPVILHPDLSKYGEPDSFITGPGTVDLENRPNVNCHFKIRKGDVERGFQEADLIIENKFSAAKIIHAQLEPHTCTAQVESDGTLTVQTSSQSIYRVRSVLSHAFNMPASKIRVTSSYLGGGFGRVNLVEPITSVLAFKTHGRPVRVTLTREECFSTINCRSHSEIYLKDGVKKDGTLLAREMKLFVDNGAYGLGGPIITSQGGLVTAPLYNVPNVKIDTYSVYTNTLIAQMMRGAGQVQPNFAIECQMDIIAERLGMDPVEFRRKNMLREGDKNICGEVMVNHRAVECMDKAVEWIGWGRPLESRGNHWKTGRGIGLGAKMTFTGSTSNAWVKVCGDGTLVLYHTTDEMGQGGDTVLTQIVAEEFKIPVDKIKDSIRLVHRDTLITPYDFGSVASRATYYTGNAVKRACQDAKRQLFELAASKIEVSADALETRGDKVYVKGMPEKSIMLAELFSPLIGGKGTFTDQYDEIMGKGTFTQPAIPYDWETGQGERRVTYYSEGVQAVEVAVNIQTGKVQVLRICSIFNVGQPINPQLVEEQMEGGMIMGIGNALYEELILDEGKILNANFMDYCVPRINDVPSLKNIKAMILEDAPHPEGPYGAKGLGEGVMLPTAPAIASAIYNAVGVRIKELPITPEKVLKAMEDARKLRG